MRYSLDSDNTDEALPMPSVFLQCLELGIPPQSTDEPLVETVAAYRIHIHSESKKKPCHHAFIRNFNKCWPIFKILSLLYSPRNLQQNSCHIAHHTLGVSLYYLAKNRNLQKFCCI